MFPKVTIVCIVVRIHWAPYGSELHMELGALLAFEKAIYPSSHLSTSCPCTPSNYRSGGISSYTFHGNVTYQSVHIVLLNWRVGMHLNHASFVYL
jgi:hypothetical protein